MIEREFDQVENRMLFRVIGKVDADHVMETVKQSIEHPDFTPGMNSIWDLTSAVLDDICMADFEAVSLAKHIKNANERGDARVAIVVSDDLGTGLSRMFAAYRSPAHIEYQVFKSVSDASVWLAGKPPVESRTDATSYHPLG